MEYEGWLKVLERWLVQVDSETAPRRPASHGAWQDSSARRIEVWVDRTNHDQPFQADWLVPTPEALGLYTDELFSMAVDWNRIQSIGATSASPATAWLPATQALAETVATLRGEALRQHYNRLVEGLRGIRGQDRDVTAARHVLASAMASAVVAEHYPGPANAELQSAVAAVLAIEAEGRCLLPSDDDALSELLRLLEEGLEPEATVLQLGFYREELRAHQRRSEKERQGGPADQYGRGDFW